MCPAESSECLAFFASLLLLFSTLAETPSQSRNFTMISIDDFRKVELKIATVRSAEPHPNADRLMVLQVDLGNEQRQICAGIRDHYTPEDLIGKQVVVVANLETAKLRGMESQGMLLAASDEGRVIFLTPEKVVQAGAKVS
ncbi:MAG TPA: methionine--tRNA ligase subunit beta [Candidatus Limnocylindria bacterium]|nr:methionine--tRNA ligase subunit beta [Candidatus Limnocylindria bacterium]